jgi:hypothetical protein
MMKTHKILILLIAVVLTACNNVPVENTPIPTQVVVPTQVAAATLVPTISAAITRPTPAATAVLTATPLPVKITPPSPTSPVTLNPVHPIVVYPPYDSASGYLLGGSQNGKWLDPAATAKSLKGGENYLLYTDKVIAGAYTGGVPAGGEPSCSRMQSVTLKPKPTVLGVFAIGGTWNALPRIPQELPVSTDTYRQAIARLLQDNGIAAPEIVLTRILKIDLEGDGVDEVIISANRFAEKTGHDVSVGDYSLVVLRKVSGNTVLTLPLVANYYLKAQKLAYPNQYTLATILDLNGDGKMEIGVGITGWEKVGALGYEVEGNAVKNVLRMSCSE